MIDIRHRMAAGLFAAQAAGCGGVSGFGAPEYAVLRVCDDGATYTYAAALVSAPRCQTGGILPGPAFVCGTLQDACETDPTTTALEPVASESEDVLVLALPGDGSAIGRRTYCNGEDADLSNGIGDGGAARYTGTATVEDLAAGAVSLDLTDEGSEFASTANQPRIAGDVVFTLCSEVTPDPE